MTYSNSNWEEKLDCTLRNRYSASLMNNTKWREVWGVVCSLELRVMMNYADDPTYAGAEQLHGPFSIDYIEERGIRDPGIGGPFLYKQTLWLRIPKKCPNNVTNFRHSINALGIIPLFETDEYFEIRGYSYTDDGIDG